MSSPTNRIGIPGFSIPFPTSTSTATTTTASAACTTTSSSPSSSPMPAAIFQHRDSFVHQRELETAFCKDLYCCGQKLHDLHELLQHYEEHHHQPEDEDHHKTVLTAMSHLHEAVHAPQPSPPPSSPIPVDPHIHIHPADLSQPMSPTLHESAAPNSTSTSTTTNISTPPPSTPPAVPHLSAEDMLLFRTEALYQSCHSNDAENKPYKCTVKGCDKAYKNPNGLKYHREHGNCTQNLGNEADAQKPYQCTIGLCRKRYKNLNGLKYHIEHAHVAKLQQLSPTTHLNSPWPALH
ncbi:Transcriptional regulator of ribosomal bioproteinsis proteins [Apophysomyces ossiformis]|uniref:Transcriptional regulator of ribosomal bioproteinsis proteins n=1 Tax=Apophysomyces ossiformis TaxID=679940 RepID=A0A8H7BRC2_9FUNG|nr:Transcriptional regulator of ribosomal bioproteinsis proteins [Apophysomyces ossiformis]